MKKYSQENPAHSSCGNQTIERGRPLVRGEGRDWYNRHEPAQTLVRIIIREIYGAYHHFFLCPAFY